MKYPAFLKKFNSALAAVSGTLMLAIAFLAVMESVLRTIFKSPTMWSVDISSYFLLCSIFLGCSYAYQEKGHVGVELFRDMIQRRWGTAPRRAVAVIGYTMALIVVIVTLIAVKNLLLPALEVRQTTFANVTIPISFLYVIMIIGSALMAITVVFIILDLIAREDKYI